MRSSPDISSCAHRTMPTPSPPRHSASRIPSSCVWPPMRIEDQQQDPVSIVTPNDASTFRSPRRSRRAVIGPTARRGGRSCASLGRVVDGADVAGRPRSLVPRWRATNSVTSSRIGSPMATAMNPSATGPVPPMGSPPGDGSARSHSMYAMRSACACSSNPNARHRAGADGDRLGDGPRVGEPEADRDVATADRVARAGDRVARGAVRGVQLPPVSQVAAGRHLRDGRSVAEGRHVGDERLDLRLVEHAMAGGPGAGSGPTRGIRPVRR